MLNFLKQISQTLYLLLIYQSINSLLIYQILNNIKISHLGNKNEPKMTIDTSVKETPNVVVEDFVTSVPAPKRNKRRGKSALPKSKIIDKQLSPITKTPFGKSV